MGWCKTRGSVVPCYVLCLFRWTGGVGFGWGWVGMMCHSMPRKQFACVLVIKCFLNSSDTLCLTVPNITSTKHLGNMLPSPQNDTCDINVKMGQFIANINKLNAQFANVSIKIKAHLLQSYCTSWYGCQTLVLDPPQTDKLNTEWNKAVRRILGLPYTTRTKLLPLLAGQNNFHWQHASRW